ncbi:hypothetical protein LOTGIDRAFT_110654, partial [Lottia gigantea]
IRSHHLKHFVCFFKWETSGLILTTYNLQFSEIQAIDSCEQPLVTGNCAYKYNSYYYNSFTGKCLPFIYTGCDGNNNRFSTLEQCQQVCVPSKNALFLYSFVKRGSM